MSDIGERFFLPKLLRHLARVAPGVSVATVSQSLPELAAGLAGGDIDLVARFLPSLGKQVHEQRLFRERFIYVSAPDTQQCAVCFSTSCCVRSPTRCPSARDAACRDC